MSVSFSWSAVAESAATASDSASVFFRSGSPGSVSSPISAIIAANWSSSVSNCSLVSLVCSVLVASSNKASISSAAVSLDNASSNKASISSAATSVCVACFAADSISVDASFKIASISSSAGFTSASSPAATSPNIASI